MTIHVDYPNEGVYSDGQPRYVVTNKMGEITFCREATPQEAMQFRLVDELAMFQNFLVEFRQSLWDIASSISNTKR